MPSRGRRQHGEGAFYQRGKRGGTHITTQPGQWVAVADLGWKNGRRDRREFTGPTPGDAMEKRDTFLASRRDGFTLPRGRPPYVGEWMLHWVHNVARAEVEATTWERSYRQKTEDLIVPYFAKIRLPDLSEEDIEGWHRHLAKEISARTGRPRSPATIVQAHRIMSRALKVAVVRGRLGRNPCSNVSPPAIPERDQLPPEEDEVIAILRECEDRRTGPRWAAAIATGTRQGEALGLLWPYVDLGEEPEIDVQWELVRLKWRHGCEDPQACGTHIRICPRRCPKVRTSGRPHTCIRAGDPRLCPPDCEDHARSCPARTGGGLRLKRPKSAKSRRRIPLNPYAAASLRRWKTDQKAERLAHPAWTGWAHDPDACAWRPRPREHVCQGCMLPARPDLMVFSWPDGMPYDSRADWQDWSELLEAAGVAHQGTHGNRHGYATALLEDGKDIRVVQELMGHATPHFTQQAYQHVRVKLRREAADTMERFMTRRR